MIFLGIDQTKKVSVDYSLLKKSWKISDKQKGKPIVAIPSDKVLIKEEKLPEGIKNEKQLRKYLELKFKNYLFDFTLENGRYNLVLVRDFEPPRDAVALDAEPFALARLSNPLGEKNLTILDLGRRKTTFVEVKNGKLSAYRVVLKGGDYITQRVAQSLNLTFEEAEKLKRQKGLGLKEVKTALEEILRQLPPLGEKVLLSGGGSKLKGLEEFLNGKTLRLPINLEPEKYTALGAALKFIYRDNSPPFGRFSISKKELKTLLYAAAILVLAAALGGELLNQVAQNYRDRLEAQKKALFKEKFPDLPAVAVEEQLLTMQPKGDKQKSLLLLQKMVKTLPRGVKIYRITYADGVLKVSGEAPKEAIKNLKTTTLKDQGNGKYLFEVEIR